MQPKSLPNSGWVIKTKYSTTLFAGYNGRGYESTILDKFHVANQSVMPVGIKGKGPTALMNDKKDTKYIVREPKPCVMVFPTEQKAQQMRHLIVMMRNQKVCTQKVEPRPHQPLEVEKWPLSIIFDTCATSALDVIVYDNSCNPVFTSEYHVSCNADVRSALDDTFNYHY